MFKRIAIVILLSSLPIVGAAGGLVVHRLSSEKLPTLRPAPSMEHLAYKEDEFLNAVSKSLRSAESRLNSGQPIDKVLDSVSRDPELSEAERKLVRYRQQTEEMVRDWKRDCEKVVAAQFESADQALDLTSKGLIAGALLGILSAVLWWVISGYIADNELLKPQTHSAVKTTSTPRSLVFLFLFSLPIAGGLIAGAVHTVAYELYPATPPAAAVRMLVTAEDYSKRPTAFIIGGVLGGTCLSLLMGFSTWLAQDFTSTKDNTHDAI